MVTSAISKSQKLEKKNEIYLYFVFFKCCFIFTDLFDVHKKSHFNRVYFIKAKSMSYFLLDSFTFSIWQHYQFLHHFENVIKDWKHLT